MGAVRGLIKIKYLNLRTLFKAIRSVGPSWVGVRVEDQTLIEFPLLQKVSVLPRGRGGGGVLYGPLGGVRSMFLTTEFRAGESRLWASVRSGKEGQIENPFSHSPRSQTGPSGTCQKQLVFPMCGQFTTFTLHFPP